MTESSGFTRRHFLTVTTAVTAGVGGVMAAVPFVASFKPSARAQALGAPVEIDVSKVEPGEMIKIEWRGKAIFIVRRTQDMQDKLLTIADLLEDPNSENDEQQPEYATNTLRSIKDDILVVEGVCTHLGCAPTARFELGAAAGMDDDWPGGFACACHGSRFDLAGRVFKSVPAPDNLKVPPHRYVNESTILIGVDAGSS
jgi:ubiquinol-cytochrome c reductase iron-sulfur subunit